MQTPGLSPRPALPRTAGYLAAEEPSDHSQDQSQTRQAERSQLPSEPACSVLDQLEAFHKHLRLRKVKRGSSPEETHAVVDDDRSMHDSADVGAQK